MSEIPSPVEIERWVAQASIGQREFRQAVHVVLCAIAHTSELRNRMVMKGGILLALRYCSPRFTKDIDFSTSLTKQELPPEAIRASFEQALPLAAGRLDYGLDCRLQKFEVLPPRPDATFPSFRMKIGYAPNGTPKHKRLLAKNCPDVLGIDFSLNEPIFSTESLSLGGATDGTVLAYGLSDLIAEKLRSLLQQESRNRFRRQDIYDLQLLLNLHWPDNALRTAILESLLKKAGSRNIEPRPDSLDSAEVRRRAEHDYDTLADELRGPPPDFDLAYATVQKFYRSLPW